MRIAHNLMVDHFRRSKKMPLYRETDEFSFFSIMTDDSLTIENKIISEQVTKDLRLIVEKLPEDQKEVLMMRLYRDMSFKEISEATGVSINTALGRMRYAIINLRKVIDKHQIILTS
jgi:RNA polymerase sigma-70 factor (ECF subfamily)